jgi:hypothetical protein
MVSERMCGESERYLLLLLSSEARKSERTMEGERETRVDRCWWGSLYIESCEGTKSHKCRGARGL